MLLTKSSSLPQLAVNFNKFDDFFPNRNHGKELALDDQVEQITENISKHKLTSKNKAHSKNLQFIDRKSTIKSKVQAYLTDSSKMGILDHTVNQSKNRRSLTKVALQSLKPVNTEVQQQKVYLKKLKTEINEFYEKNKKIEKQIKNNHGMITQVKQKIIFYTGLLARNSISQEQLLSEREHNVVLIRFESDKLKFILERLKQINILMKKRVKEAQNNLKHSQFKAKTWNEIESIKQQELDNKIYLLKHFEEFQSKKSENLAYKTQKAMKNMSENNTAEILKRRQQCLSIMTKQEYNYLEITQNHMKLMAQINAQKFTGKLLDSIWTKYSAFYESYEKAQQMIKMYSLDRKCLVQDSYKKSFQIKEILNQSIKSKEKSFDQLTQKNKMLKQEWGNINFGEIEQQERKIEQIRLEFKTGKKDFKNQKQKAQYLFQKSILSRMSQVDRKNSLMNILKNWIVKKQLEIKIEISKKLPIHKHFEDFINTLKSDILKYQSNYSLNKLIIEQKKEIPKVNKFGNLKKKK